MLQMLVGVVGFNVLDVLPSTEQRAVGVLLTSYVFQGSSNEVRRGRSASLSGTVTFRSGLLHDLLLHLHLYHPVRASPVLRRF